MDEEVKKKIYTAANEHAAGHIDPVYISRHHFVAGAIWAFSDQLIQGFLDQEKPASQLINRIKTEDSGFVDEVRLEIVKIQNTLRELKVQFH